MAEGMTRLKEREDDEGKQDPGKQGDPEGKKITDPVGERQKKKTKAKTKVKTKTKTKAKAKKKIIKKDDDDSIAKVFAKKGYPKKIGVRLGVVEQTLDLKTGKQVTGSDVSDKIPNDETTPKKSFRLLETSKSRPKKKEGRIGFIKYRLTKDRRGVELYGKARRIR